MLFCSIWSLLVLAYLIISTLYFPTAAHRFGILVAEGLTMLFWFAGFIAWAVWLHDYCTGRFGVCRVAEAADVFGAFLW